jgi:hypothetical protein
LPPRVCDGDSAGDFFVLDETQRASTLAFGWPVGETLVRNSNREMVTMILKVWLEALTVQIKSLRDGIFSA